MTAVGDLVRLTIEKVVHGGRGMGRWDGAPVFVAGALNGEHIAARVTAARKGYVEAALDRVFTSSAQRVEPPCPSFPACGGCQLQHAAYDAQLALKRDIVRETFQRLGQLDIDVPPVVPSPEPFGYRLRAQLKIARTGRPPAIGYFAAGTHHVVAAPTCLVLHPRLQAALTVLRELVARSDALLAGVREVELQTTSAADECVIVLRLDSLRAGTLRALARTLRTRIRLRGLVAYTPRGRRVEGVDWLEERISGLSCRVSDRTFLQINAGVNATLVKTVVAWAELKGGERIVDLYAGFGNFSLPLAAMSHVTAVESSATAAADARWNARATGRNVRVVGRRVEAWTPTVDDERPELVVLDPPRAGLSRPALARVLSLDAPRLLYVSCEPATLARDARRFIEAGYHVTRLQSFDFFPQTAHVETLAEFRRR
jgi:23S rRNA (uracil1939-C5)-methyltransferase